MPDLPEKHAGNVIVFRFNGGALDGQELRSDQSAEGMNEAQRLWAMTRMGAVGRRFDVPPANSRGTFHRYKVINNSNVGGETYVTCQYVGES